MAEILLGQKVKDTITGLKGVAVARTEYLYGCVRISVQPSGVKDGKVAEWVNVDEPQLVVVGGKPAEKVPPVHGPRPSVDRAPSPTQRA